MPDSQGFATKEEILEALKDLELEGGAAGSRVTKVVACAGFVKVWAGPDLGLDGAMAVQRFLASKPGVKAVTVVPGAE